jgi:hypothetical protein
MIDDLQSMTDYDSFLDRFCHRIRSARVGLRSNFSVDVITAKPHEKPIS